MPNQKLLSILVVVMICAGVIVTVHAQTSGQGDYMQCVYNSVYGKAHEFYCGDSDCPGTNQCAHCWGLDCIYPGNVALTGYYLHREVDEECRVCSAAGSCQVSLATCTPSVTSTATEVPTDTPFPPTPIALHRLLLPLILKHRP